MKTYIENLGFELSLSDSDTRFDYENSEKVAMFIATVELKEALSENADAQKELETLKKALAEYKKKTSTLSKEDLKKVYLMLKNREIHPKGEFDKMGRFYLNDSELVNVRSPSVKYPYTQMSAGRTSKFVKAIADKYACNTIEELISRFKRA